MSYRVLAPLVLVRDEAGRTHHMYEGAVVDFIDADHATYLCDNGMLAGDTPSVGADDGGKVVAEVNGGDPGVDLPRPPHVAAKARWVDFAVDQGFAREEAESMTKEKLISALS